MQLENSSTIVYDLERKTNPKRFWQSINKKEIKCSLTTA